MFRSRIFKGESVFCPRCGHELPDDSRFCFKCGKSLEAVGRLSGEPSREAPETQSAVTSNQPSAIPTGVLPPQSPEEPQTPSEAWPEGGFAVVTTTDDGRDPREQDLGSSEKWKPAPSGVRGWLYPPIAGLLLTPILGVYLLSQSGEVWVNGWFFTVALLSGAMAGTSYFVVVALVNRWPSAPRLTQAQ
jgi:hypothetical protein